jgi:hypothetical protein
MKIVKYFAMMAAVVATLASCEDPNDGPGGGQQSTLKATASATTIYADGKDAHYMDNPHSYTVTKKTVTAKSKMTLRLAAGGGVAIAIKEL